MSRPVQVLPAAGVFGANASGKTMILRAIDDMRRLVLKSFRDGSRGTPVSRHPFLLDPECRDRPTRFEIDLVLAGVRWIYGLQVDDERVLEEYAYHWPRGRQALVFSRDTDGVTYGSRFRAGGRALDGLLRSNSLLLSVGGAAGARPLGRLFEWFRSNLRLWETGNRVRRAFATAGLAQTERARVLKMLRAADLGVTGLDLKRLDGEVADHFRRIAGILGDREHDLGLPTPGEMDDGAVSEITLTHAGHHGGVPFRQEDESQGTMAWLSLIGPLLEILDKGQVVLVDELDSSLHSHLVERVIDMFQDPQINRRGGQLIFNSHDGAILEGRGRWALGRDQVWFTEKYADGATKLYSLDDFSPRRDADIRGRYYAGRFGALPLVGDAAIREALHPSTNE